MCRLHSLRANPLPALWCIPITASAWFLPGACVGEASPGRYQVEILDPGTFNDYYYDLGPCGELVGSRQPLLLEPGQRPYVPIVRSSQIVSVLPSLGTSSVAVVTNRAGWIAGYFLEDGQTRPFLAPPEGAMVPLPTLGHPEGMISGLDSTSTWISGHTLAAPGDPRLVPVVWRIHSEGAEVWAEIQPLPLPGTSWGIANGVSESGDVAGTLLLPEGESRVVRWRRLGTGGYELQDLGAGYGLGMSDAGVVVGSRREPEGQDRAHVWVNGLATQLPLAEGCNGCPSYAFEANARGLVGGHVKLEDGRDRAVVWNLSRLSRAPVILEESIDGEGEGTLSLTSVLRVNRNGVILATGELGGRPIQAVLKPVVSEGDPNPEVDACSSSGETASPVLGLTGDSLRENVLLSWWSPQNFDALKVLRDGEVVAEIGGGRGSFLDSPAPPGNHTYRIVGQLEGVELESPPVFAYVTSERHQFTFRTRSTKVQLGEDGRGSFTVRPTIDEVTTGSAPVAVDSFSMGLAHDPALLRVMRVRPGPVLAAALEAWGPDAFRVIELPGMTILEAEIPGQPLLISLSEDEPALEIDYQTLGLQITGSIATPIELLPEHSRIVADGIHGLVTLLDSEVILWPVAQPLFQRGDANQDLRVDLSDTIAILGNLFRGDPPSLDCRDAADANDDGKVDISDAVFILAWLFNGGPSPFDPLAPFRADITADGEGCPHPAMEPSRPPCGTEAAVNLSEVMDKTKLIHEWIPGWEGNKLKEITIPQGNTCARVVVVSFDTDVAVVSTAASTWLDLQKHRSSFLSNAHPVLNGLNPAAKTLDEIDTHIAKSDQQAQERMQEIHVPARACEPRPACYKVTIEAAGSWIVSDNDLSDPEELASLRLYVSANGNTNAETFLHKKAVANPVNFVAKVWVFTEVYSEGFAIYASATERAQTDGYEFPRLLVESSVSGVQIDRLEIRIEGQSAPGGTPGAEFRPR